MDICDLQTFANCLEDIVVVIDENFRVLFANAATLRTFRRTADEVINQPCYTTFHNQVAPCDDRLVGACPVRTVRATGQPARARHHHPDASGLVHTVEIFAAPMSCGEHGSTLVVESMREITRQAELEVETAQRHREFSVLNQITTAVARSLDAEALAPELVDVLSVALEVSSAAIYQFCDGEPVQLAGRGTQLPFAVVQALADEQLSRDAPLVLDDMRTSEGRTTPLPAGSMPGALLCLPLSAGDGSRGMLVLGDSTPRPWSEHDIRLAAMAAQQIAIGLERCRLFHAESERRRSLEKANHRLRTLERTRRQALQCATMAQENERRRIAAELHDGTVQSLAALIVGLDTAAAMLDHSPVAAREQVTRLKRAAGAIIEDIDNIIAALRPALLDDLGLLPALQAYASDRLDPLDVAWEFQASATECFLPPPADMVLFRVVQEAISNIARHAHARQVVIAIQLDAEGIYVKVNDDGVGFDMREKLDPGCGQPSLGLLGMQERLETLHGRLQIQSAPGQGTQLRVFVPREPGGPPK